MTADAEKCKEKKNKPAYFTRTRPVGIVGGAIPRGIVHKVYDSRTPCSVVNIIQQYSENATAGTSSHAFRTEREFGARAIVENTMNAARRILDPFDRVLPDRSTRTHSQSAVHGTIESVRSFSFCFKGRRPGVWERIIKKSSG